MSVDKSGRRYWFSFHATPANAFHRYKGETRTRHWGIDSPRSISTKFGGYGLA